MSVTVQLSWTPLLVVTGHKTATVLQPAKVAAVNAVLVAPSQCGLLPTLPFHPRLKVSRAAMLLVASSLLRLSRTLGTT